VCGRTTESTIIGLIVPEPATRIVTTFDICRFQGVTALALTTLWEPLVYAINLYKANVIKCKFLVYRSLLLSTAMHDLPQLLASRSDDQVASSHTRATKRGGHGDSASAVDEFTFSVN
jgi:hypothetical protein